MHSTINRALALTGITASLVLPFALTSTASATSTAITPRSCLSAPTQANFTATYATGSVTDVTIKYTGKLPLCATVTQAVSFNTYLTQGPTWPTSGSQTLVSHLTADLSNKVTSAHFVSKIGANCFYQTDAYVGAKRFDGIDGVLPKYPNAVLPTTLLAARNGGTKVCTLPTPTPISTPKPMPTATPVATPQPTPTPTPVAGKGEVLSVATSLPTVGSGDIALGISTLGGAAAYLLKRRSMR